MDILYHNACPSGAEMYRTHHICLANINPPEGEKKDDSGRKADRHLGESLSSYYRLQNV